MDLPPQIDAVITRRRDVADTIVEFQMRRRDGRALPAFQPGAHLEVETPSGLVRHYSLVTAPSPQPQSYEIAVGRDPHSEGGSLSMHQHLHPGATVRIGHPQGGYAVPKEADEILLVAGGVGITPILSVYRQIKADGGLPVRLIYLCRRRTAAAYLEEFDPEDVVLHAKEEHNGERLNLWDVLAEPGNRRMLCCGPGPLLDEVRALTMHWRESHLRFEDFRGVTAIDPYAAAFTAMWKPTDTPIAVSANQTLLEALEENGIRVPSSCRSGTCGTCRIRVHCGEVQHRDLILSGEEQRGGMLCCVSRAEGPLVIGPMNGL